jgi:hypothetical protein
MVVKIIEYVDNNKVETLEECDRVKVFKKERTIHLVMLTKGQEDDVKAYTFANKARIFIMEKGSTIDRIDF